MIGPCVGVNENLNDRNHSEQGERRQARRQTKKKKRRSREFIDHRHARRYGRCEERNFVFVFKQFHGEFEGLIFQ